MNVVVGHGPKVQTHGVHPRRPTRTRCGRTVSGSQTSFADVTCTVCKKAQAKDARQERS